MKIEIRYPKIANLYSFISNLSQWNELVCVPQRKKEWIQKTGSLNQNEKDSLKEFEQIFQGAKTNLEPIFLFEDPRKIWPTLLKRIGKTKSEKIQSVFKIFESRFNKIWNKEDKKMKGLKKNFIDKKSQIDDNLEIIKKLCRLEKQQIPEKIEVKLLFSSNAKEDCQGWSFKEKIVLECSGWPMDKTNYLINNIFLHECFHILFKKNKKLFSVLKSIINKNRQLLKETEFAKWTPEIVFEETLISSFLPEGYLSEKNLGIDARKAAQKELAKKNTDAFTKLRNFCALRLYNLAKKYCNENKSLDKFYFEKAIKCFKIFISQNRKEG